MKYPKYLPYLIFFSGIIVSFSSGFFSVYGLSLLFSGVFFQSIFIFSSLELSKLVIATAIYRYWKTLNFFLKLYLSVALFILVVVTSVGVYGFLSGGYKQTSNKLELFKKESSVIALKKDRFQFQLNELNSEKSKVVSDISDLRNKNVTTQFLDKKTGQIVSSISTQSQKSYNSQLNDAIKRRDDLSTKIETISDSITKLDVQLLDMENKSSISNELGPLKFISDTFSVPMDSIVKYLLLLLVLVIDPLAVILLITANHAFKLGGETTQVKIVEGGGIPLKFDDSDKIEYDDEVYGYPAEQIHTEPHVNKIDIIQDAKPNDENSSITETEIEEPKVKVIPELSSSQKRIMSAQEIKEFYENINKESDSQ